MPVRAAGRSLYICQACRRFLQGPSVTPPGSTASKRWIGAHHTQKIQNAEAQLQKRAELIESGHMKSMVSILEERGYINQIVGSRDELDRLFTRRRVGVYAGVDPTAPSMHVGHMVPFMALAWLYIHGYGVHFVLGGFTAQVGDPTGRLTGRAAMSPATRKTNVASMHAQLKRFGQSMERYAARRGYAREWAWRRAVENNATWWSRVLAKDLLLQLGRSVRLGPMLGRDTVERRLQKDGQGMSFAEFSYPLVQAWDWWHLFRQGVQVQIGGADQFGNILAGVEGVKLIAHNNHEYQQDLRVTQMHDDARQVRVSSDPMGFTVPLLTTASGDKFGKSAGNAIWLDADMTSHFDLYQFFLRSADDDVEKYLKLFTFLPLDQIQGIMRQHATDTSQRVAQHTLAKEFVELIHGLDAANQAEAEHRQLFDKALRLRDVLPQEPTAGVDASAPGARPTSPNADFIHPSLNKHAAPQHRETSGPLRIKLPRSLVIGKPLSHAVWAAGLVSSKKEGHRLISQGGLYVGAQSSAKGGMEDALSFAPAKSTGWEENAKYVLDHSVLILRSGKWKLRIITLVPDHEYEQSGQSCPAWEQWKLEQAAAAGPDADRLAAP